MGDCLEHIYSGDLDNVGEVNHYLLILVRNLVKHLRVIYFKKDSLIILYTGLIKKCSISYKYIR